MIKQATDPILKLVYQSSGIDKQKNEGDPLEVKV